MILTVDIGNSHIKVGAWDNETLVFVARLQTNIHRTQDEHAIGLLDVMRLHGCNSAQFDGAIIASVVPALSLPFRGAVAGVIQSRRVYLVSAGLKTGLNIKIDNPATLGADMVCAAVGLLAKYPPPAIIISMGTATALFALDADGSFLGGSLYAGVGVSLEALSERAALLPLISLAAPEELIGTNTVDSLRSGVIYGNAGMLDGIIGRMKEVLGPDTIAIATGGFARHIAGHCRESIVIEDNLILEGLRIIYHKNSK